MYIISTEGPKTGYVLQVPNLTPVFKIGVNGERVIKIRSAEEISLNEWSHLTATFDGNFAKLYVDGVLQGEEALDYSIMDNGENFRIGEGSRFTGRTFIGRISDVRIWDQALSEEEILASLSNRLIGEEEGLIAWWPLNLSAGNNVVDRTGEHAVTLIGVQYVDPIQIPR